MAKVSDAEVLSSLARLEQKLDLLITALATEESNEEFITNLDGEEMPAAERDQSQSLG